MQAKSAFVQIMPNVYMRRADCEVAGIDVKGSKELKWCAKCSDFGINPETNICFIFELFDNPSYTDA